MVDGIAVIIPSQRKLGRVIAKKYLWVIRVGREKIEHVEERVTGEEVAELTDSICLCNVTPSEMYKRLPCRVCIFKI